MEVSLTPITAATADRYLQVGQQSYNEHYLHLWENRDPKSYLKVSFTQTQIRHELQDPNCKNYLVDYGQANAGVLKLSLDQGWGSWTDEEALYLHRIYLLKAFSGKGVGKAVLEFVTRLAQDLGKKVIWLETMKKGKALHFYHNNGFEITGDTEIYLEGVLPEEKEMWVMVKYL